VLRVDHLQVVGVRLPRVEQPRVEGQEQRDLDEVDPHRPVRAEPRLLVDPGAHGRRGGETPERHLGRVGVGRPDVADEGDVGRPGAIASPTRIGTSGSRMLNVPIASPPSCSAR
jgi:hypothetical protein